MRVCAGIVIFHPDMDRLQLCIDAILPQVDELVLVNNSPEIADELQGRFASSVLKWINNERNLGIAAALNQILSYAHKSGYKWILTLDQDSVCQEGLARKLLTAARDNANAAMVSPCIIERGVIWEDRKRKKRQRSRESGPPPEVEEVAFCITSGTLTSVEAVHNAGGWDERLFIDEVDRDICIRLRYRGHRLLRVNTAAMHHEFGSELVSRRILFKVYKYRNYSPFRVYYQMRNLVYMVRKYGSDYKSCPPWRLIRPFFTFFVKFIFEPQRLARLSAFVRGYAAGLFMKL